MTRYIVTLAASTDRHLVDDQAVAVATTWATALGLAQGMTSTHAEQPWLRVQGMTTDSDARGLADHAEAELLAALRAIGATVTAWHTVEIIDEDEAARRLENATLPPVYTAAEFAAAANLTRQRIQQYESDRRAGKRDDFPAPILAGHWLRAQADHWIATRRTARGPAPAHRGNPLHAGRNAAARQAGKAATEQA